MPAHRLPQRLPGDRVVALQIATEVRRVAEEHVVGVQLVRLAAEAPDGLQAEHELRLRLHASAFDLVLGRAVTSEPADFLLNRALELPESVAGRRRRGNLQIS